MRTIVISFIAAAILFLVNQVLPLTFSAYMLTMLLCMLPLLWLSRHEGWSSFLLLLPWSVAFMASILITRNFFYPDIKTARNTDVYILELSSLTTDSAGQKRIFRLNFPKHSPEDAGQRLKAVISTDINQIMADDVNAAFHFENKEGNLNMNFSGTISYTVGDFRQPLNAVMEVDSLSLAAQGWRLSIHDMRDTVKPTWCMAIVVVMFAFVLVMLFCGRPTSAASMLCVWLFFICGMVGRIYDVMRMAYYPPLNADEYTYQIYRSSVTSRPMDNPLYQTVVVIVLAVVLTVYFRRISNRIPQWLKVIFSTNDAELAMKRLRMVFAAMVVCMAMHWLGVDKVITNICIPMLLFFAAQYYCLRIRNEYRLRYHLLSFILTLVSIGIGDPGYAIIFIEFCLVWILYVCSLYISSTNQISRWRDALLWVRIPIVLCLIVLLFIPQYAVLIIYKNPGYAFCFLTVIGVLIVFALWVAGFVRRIKWIATALGCVLFISSLMSFGGSKVLEKKENIIYRSESIAGTDPNELLLNTTLSNTPLHGTGAVFSATQNAWFINENLKHGKQRVFEDGIYQIQPHSAQIVKYETQLCDVLASRHFVLEVSALYPVLYSILLTIVFVMVCCRRDESSRHKFLAYGVALFILLETIYTLFSGCLNWALFVGQDFSLLTMGKTKLLFEAFLIAYLTYGSEESDEEPDDEAELAINEGTEHVCSPKTAKWLIIVLLFTSGVLYAFSPLEKGTTPAAFSGRKALKQVQEELAPLNELLKNCNVPREELHNGQDVSHIWQALTAQVDLEAATCSMSILGKSIVKYFVEKRQYDNKANTLIYLTLDRKAGYQLRVNEYQWSYEMPYFTKGTWHGNIIEKYATTVEEPSTNANTNMPDGWQPKRETIRKYRKLVRDMCVNGKSRTYYSLKDPWLRNVISAARYTLKSQENITLTLDGKLQEHINDWLKRSNMTSSVVVVNGLGEVLTMSQNNLSANVDPNNKKIFDNQRMLSELGGKDEESLIKNLNMDVMNPGVGSSLKPIIAASAISMLGLRFDQFNMESLGLSPGVDIRTDLKSGKSFYRTTRFAGAQFQPNWPFESLVGDETGGDDRLVSFSEYLSQSSNYYNAALLTMLTNRCGTIIDDLFHDATESDIPKIFFGPYRLGLNRPTGNVSESYLSYCLQENFGFGDTHAHDDFLGKLTTDDSKKIFPLINMRSAVLNEQELQTMTPATRLQRLCTGSIQAYSLTPILMAELYGKLCSGKSDFTCALVPREKQFTKLFRNQKGVPDSLIYESCRILFSAMRDCAANGTASIHNISDLWPHIYAKTGTLGSTETVGDDRMLAVLLSQNALETARLGEAKFVIIYFRTKNNSLKNVREIVREVINSRSFSEYMISNN